MKKNTIHFFFFSPKEYSVQVTFREQWHDERLGYIDNTDGNKNYIFLSSVGDGFLDLFFCKMLFLIQNW